MNNAPEMLAIVGATIVDGNGDTPINDGVIVIDGKQIVEVGDRSTQIPRRAKQIAATGKFVIPGLMNAAVWLVDGSELTTLIRYEGRYDELAIEAAQIGLKNGVTTVFDTWGPRDSLIKARDAINQGRVAGARIYLAGNVVGWGGPFSTDLRPQFRDVVPKAFADRIEALWQQNVGQALTWVSPEEVREEIRKYAHSGVDFLNYAVTVHRLSAEQYIVFSPRVQQVIVEEAHRAELAVVAQAPGSSEGLVLGLNAGVDLMQGFLIPSDPPAGISAEAVALIAKRQIPCGLSLDTRKDVEWYRQHAQTRSHVETNFRKWVELHDRDNRALLDSGALVLLATFAFECSSDTYSDYKEVTPPDVGTFIRSFGETHFYWLRAAQDMAMKPMAALMAATRNIASAYKVDNNLGTLERGKLADLVILDRNPLENAENYRSIHLVMKEGKVIDRDALPTQRLITAPPVESE